ncbi:MULTISPECIES: 50S ribosomal protein L21 [unclassified Caulobacter]|jgi:large subunit ribosomal protein L21|uniref:50S ribosomal protein L21 n=1 Tax=unclassified Caulobacter TaxID=2648921 RepID=UPI0006FF8164|nr:MULTISPECIES: 50S ribosomal protein L21 [unclassified Caulobacter]KQV62530.1 50S ribosomal protein L21 [Caulobacter sp. Root342]KQV65460.1 50S ribosomal protein L21 [Caulobacter sp. Root343]
MYAVIKTGGKQYRVQAGDLLVVEKLEGEPGAAVAFGEVLMLGEGEAVTVGAPTVDGAVVSGTLLETRKGEKVKIFKKIRRQGYRRTRGHRQFESVVRVTSVVGAGLEAKWDGAIDLTPKVILNARARGLGDAAVPATIPTASEAAPAAPKKAAKAPKAEATAEAAPKKKAAPKKAAATTEEGEA